MPFLDVEFFPNKVQSTRLGAFLLGTSSPSLAFFVLFLSFSFSIILLSSSSVWLLLLSWLFIFTFFDLLVVPFECIGLLYLSAADKESDWSKWLTTFC